MLPIQSRSLGLEPSSQAYETRPRTGPPASWRTTARPKAFDVVRSLRERFRHPLAERADYTRAGSSTGGSRTHSPRGLSPAALPFAYRAVDPPAPLAGFEPATSTLTEWRALLA